MTATLSDGTPVEWLREGDVLVNELGSECRVRQLGDGSLVRAYAFGKVYSDHWSDVSPRNPITKFRVGDIVDSTFNKGITVVSVPGQKDARRPAASYCTEGYTGTRSDGSFSTWGAACIGITIVTPANTTTKKDEAMTYEDKTKFDYYDIDELIRTVIEWPGACLDGKVEFLLRVMSWRTTTLDVVGESFKDVIEYRHPDKADEYLRKAGVRTDVVPKWTPSVGDVVHLYEGNPCPYKIEALPGGPRPAWLSPDYFPHRVILLNQRSQAITWDSVEDLPHYVKATERWSVAEPPRQTLPDPEG